VKLKDFLPGLSLPICPHDLKGFSRLVLTSQAINLEKICRVLKQGYKVLLAMRSKDGKWSTWITMNEFEKLCGLGSEGGGMRSASVFANDAWFTLGQFIGRGKFYTLNGVKKVASGSFPNVTHAVMPQIHGLENLGEESCFDRTRRKDKLEINKIQFIVCLSALVNVNTRPICIFLHKLKLSVIKNTPYFFLSSKTHPTLLPTAVILPTESRFMHAEGAWRQSHSFTVVVTSFRVKRTRQSPLASV
jgi:hypothetical protein